MLLFNENLTYNTMCFDAYNATQDRKQKAASSTSNDAASYKSKQGRHYLVRILHFYTNISLCSF